EAALVAGLGVGRQRHDGHVGVGGVAAEEAEQVHPVQTVAQVDVHQDGVVAGGGGQVEGGTRVAGDLDRVGRAEHVLHQEPGFRVVFYEQDLGHGQPPGRYGFRSG